MLLEHDLKFSLEVHSLQSDASLHEVVEFLSILIFIVILFE